MAEDADTKQQLAHGGAHDDSTKDGTDTSDGAAPNVVMLAKRRKKTKVGFILPSLIPGSLIREPGYEDAILSL